MVNDCAAKALAETDDFFALLEDSAVHEPLADAFSRSRIP